MNKNIDLTKILKDCPKGTKFYSLAHGEVEFQQVEFGFTYPIVIKTKNNVIERFTSDGKLYCYDGECILFPSKDQRDWSKFTAPWYKKLIEPKFKVGDKIVNVPKKYMGASGTQGTILKVTEDKYIFTDGSYMFISNQDSWDLVIDKKAKFDPNTLKPFDRVLVRDYNDDKWVCSIFSHIEAKDSFHYECILELTCKYCIPYNEDTKHLVGTAEEAPEYYRYWED